MEGNDGVSNKSDEEWLINQAKTCLKTDPYAAKAWLITARTLFPRSFPLQYETYTTEKNNKNVQEVAKLLEDMLKTFPQECQLWAEVQSLSSCLQSDSNDDRTIFLKAVFQALPPSLQCHVLVQVAEKSTDLLHQCRLMLLVLSRYPQQVPDQGVKLVESLLSAEKHPPQPSPVNCYRKYLVCDVLPVVLKSELPQVTHKHLYRWLHKAIEFYICYLTQPPIQETLLPSSPELKSPTSKSYSSGVKRVMIPGLSEKDSHIDDCWIRLYETFQLAATHLQWKVENLAPGTSGSRQWSWLQSQWEGASQHQADPGSAHVKHVLYSATFLFLHSLHKYCCQTDPEMISGSSMGQAVVLVEAFKSESSSVTDMRPKKLKRDAMAPKINSSRSLEEASDVIDNFVTAMKCWEMMHSSESLEKEFSKMLQHWKSENWIWLKRFEVEVLIYQGYFKEAMSKLQIFHTMRKGPSSQLRTNIQAACCYYFLGNYTQACDMVLQLVHLLPPSGCEPGSHDLGYVGSGRQLQLMVCSTSEALPYCIHLLVSCFRERAFYTSHPVDHMLGHMIILMQYGWPRYEPLFCDIMTKIRRQGSFSYSLFFNYVVNIDMLEEFAYLKTPDGGKVNLDILPTSQKAITQTRTVTRGVNKGVKEDFKAALEKQVARSCENIETTLRQFLAEERELLQQSFS